jgi:hypothetical protein
MSRGERARAMPGGRLPNFLLIGAPKAGSTALADYLREHPDVFIPPEKEIYFFDMQLARGLDWYRSRFAAATTERAVGDATPTYLYSDRALEAMATVIPDARLLVILRNPVDRAYSSYWYEHALSERRSFEEAVRAEIDGTLRNLPKRRPYLDTGRYLPRLERVAGLFGRAALCVVTLEEMRVDPSGVFREVCRFIGVDDSFVPSNLGAIRNPSYRVRWPAVRRAMFRYRAWRRLPRGWANALDRLNRAEFRYPPLDAALRAELSALFAEDNRALAAWLGKDLDAWNG